MSDLLDPSAGPRERRSLFGVVATFVVIALVAAIGVALVFRFVEAERARDMRSWQIRLGIVADSRAAAIGAWLQRQWSEVSGVAGNESVRLLLSELKLAQGNLGAVADGAGQVEYLQNLLAVTADRAGFVAPILGAEVPANVPRVGLAGLAILDLDGRPIVASRGAPAGEGALQAFVAAAPRGKQALKDIFVDAAGKPAMGFLAPIYRIQGAATPDQQVGWILGVKEVEAGLFPLLIQPGVVEASAEAILVRARGAVIEYLSPLKNGKSALALSLARNTPELAAAAALAAPGGFGAKRDYRDKNVLFTSRVIEGTPWLLFYKVDSAEALADTNRRQRQLLTTFLLAILLLSVAVLAVWRHGASRRASVAAARYHALADRFERQGNFLRLVTDSQPNAIFILDAEGRYRFVNRRAADEAGIAAEDMVGKTIGAVLGPDAAKRHERNSRAVMEDGEPVSATTRYGEGAKQRVLQTAYIPIEAQGDAPNGTLVVEEDVTAAVMERERRARTLDRLVKSLVTLVDQRDPFAAHHSARVAAVARAIAREMGLDPMLVETAEIAGNLMNVGKILVPSDILTKAGALSDAEISQVRDSLRAGANFLEGLEFDGPVVETLRQCQEHWDGSGRPRGLVGEAILPTARVVAVANAFVAMMSPRAHRTGLDIDTAIEALLADISRRFDRGTVAALIGYLENKGGRLAWAELAKDVKS